MEEKARGDGEVNQTYTTNTQKGSPKKDPKHIPMSRGRGGPENSINHSSDPLILLESGFAMNKLLLGTNP